MRISLSIMESVLLSHPSRVLRASLSLPSSKSESNRALIIQALCMQEIGLSNVSDARDTQTMQRLLALCRQSPAGPVWLDVLDAGTTMRFLTAFCAVTGRQARLTGTARMCERPIGLLVEALQTLGADIRYVAQPGFPPIDIQGFVQQTDTLQIRGDVSSQFISALLLVGPVLPTGITLQLTGTISSKPYIEMTMALMRRFGAEVSWLAADTIRVAPVSYKAGDYQVESDWSGASYWYSAVALAAEADVLLEGLLAASLQGDSIVQSLMRPLGVETTFEAGGARLRKIPSATELTFDFGDCPDLAQTVAVLCAAKQIRATLTGLHSLRLKETDRLAALVSELSRLGATARAEGDHTLHIHQGIAHIDGQTVHTYDDHRMAMAFAPLALLGPLHIEAPQVVQKSYPAFWQHLKKAGFEAILAV